jgi:signal transduction histidine kinase
MPVNSAFDTCNAPTEATTVTETGFPNMNLNKVTLAFEDELEEAFQEDYFDASIGLLRTSFILGMVYYTVFSALDLVALSDVSPRIIRIRFLFVVPIVLFIYLLSFTEGFRRWWQLGAAIATLTSGVGIVAMTVVPNELARNDYYAGITLILIYCYMLIRLRFIWASLTGWAIVTLYGLSLVISPGVSGDVMTANLFFLASANVLGMFGGYALEYYTRKDFYYRHLLHKEQQKVEEANSRLEERVKEKTEALRQDIRRRKEIEDALRAYRERLEDLVEERTRELHDAQARLVRKERLAVLGELAGSVAHELRNPLGAIRNGAYLLNLLLEGRAAAPEVEETLELLDREVVRSERIIGALLDYADVVPPTRHQTDLNAAAQTVLSRQTLPDDVELELDLDDAPPTVLADREQLEEVIDHLVRNAVQAMPDGGRLRVSIERSTGNGDQRSTDTNGPPVQGDEWVEIVVSDTGEGIREENLEQVFEPLYSTRTQGIGLGLALVKRLVEGHGGHIGVESEVDEGSTFTVRIPSAEKDVGGDESPRPEISP